MLKSDIEVTEIVENWLEELSKNMVDTLKKLMKKVQSEGDHQNLFEKYPSQIICLNNELNFYRSCNKHI